MAQAATQAATTRKEPSRDVETTHLAPWCVRAAEVYARDRFHGRCCVASPTRSTGNGGSLIANGSAQMTAQVVPERPGATSYFFQMRQLGRLDKGVYSTVEAADPPRRLISGED
jgi:hypothetical protein